MASDEVEMTEVGAEIALEEILQREGDGTLFQRLGDRVTGWIPSKRKAKKQLDLAKDASMRWGTIGLDYGRRGGWVVLTSAVLLGAPLALHVAREEGNRTT